jgi:hypothetical protein
MTSTTIVDVATVKICQQLIALNNRQEKHEAIVDLCRDILQRM